MEYGYGKLAQHMEFPRTATRRGLEQEDRQLGSCHFTPSSLKVHLVVRYRMSIFQDVGVL